MITINGLVECMLYIGFIAFIILYLDSKKPNDNQSGNKLFLYVAIAFFVVGMLFTMNT
jgi:hypothetical protein